MRQFGAKVAVVTGGTQGLGAVIAKLLVERAIHGVQTNAVSATAMPPGASAASRCNRPLRDVHAICRHFGEAFENHPAAPAINGSKLAPAFGWMTVSGFIDDNARTIYAQ